MSGPVLYSVGHGTRPIEVFLDLLRSAGVGRLVDVRSFPSSRKWPWLSKDALAGHLAESGIEYIGAGAELGGFRRTHEDSRHTALTSAGFRGYADHMETEVFQRGLRSLIETARDVPGAFMCAESMWWRCHRRLLSDALSVAGCEVVHLLDRGRRERHRLHPAARLVGGTLVYDVEAEGAGPGPPRVRGRRFGG